MSMSGISVRPEVLEIYELMRKKKNEKRCMFLNIYKEGKEEVCLSKETPADENITTLEDLQNAVKDRYTKKACYIVFDYHHQQSGTHKEDLVLIKFVDDEAHIKDRMLYGSTFNTLKQKFSGIKKFFELTDPDDIPDIAKGV